MQHSGRGRVDVFEDRCLLELGFHTMPKQQNTKNDPVVQPLSSLHLRGKYLLPPGLRNCLCIVYRSNLHIALGHGIGFASFQLSFSHAVL